jgi:hypothetical protein
MTSKQPYARFHCDEKTGKDGKLIFGRTWKPRKKARWLVDMFVVFPNGEREERQITIRKPVRFDHALKQAIQPEVNDMLPVGCGAIETGFVIFEI